MLLFIIDIPIRSGCRDSLCDVEVVVCPFMNTNAGIAAAVLRQSGNSAIQNFLNANYARG